MFSFINPKSVPLGCIVPHPPSWGGAVGTIEQPTHGNGRETLREKNGTIGNDSGNDRSGKKAGMIAGKIHGGKD